MESEMSYPDTLAHPFNIVPEKAVLGAILLDNVLYTDASLRLTCEDFYLASHQTIYKFMAQMLDRGMVVDLVTLANALRNHKELESVGGVEYLASLTEGLPQRLSIESWVRIIKDKSLLRQIMNASSAAMLQASDEQDTPLDVVNRLESRLLEISQRSTVNGLSLVGDIFQQAFSTVDDIYNHRKQITGVQTHYPDIDRLTCGFQKADLIIIAARPSMGKTALAVNIAQRVATKSDLSVAVFSLEMSKEALVRRMLASQSMIPLRQIQTGCVPEDEREGIFDAIEQLSNAKLFVDDSAAISLAEMRAKAMRLKRSPAGLDLIVLDYLQLMSAVHPGSRQKFENRTQEVSSISRGLKALAKELDVPVVALSQLSRANEASVANHLTMGISSFLGVNYGIQAS